jgi:hypothetical protein
MEDITTICQLINQLNNIVSQTHPIKSFEELKLSCDNFLKENMELKELNIKYEKELKSKQLELNQKTKELEDITKVSLIHTLTKELNKKTKYIQLLEKSKIISNQNINKINSDKSVKQVVTEEQNIMSDIDLDIIDLVSKEETVDVKGKEETFIVKEKEEPVVVKGKEESVDVKGKEETVIKEKEAPVVVKEKEKFEPVIEEEKLVFNEHKKSKKREQIFNPEEFEEINGYELIIYKKKYYLRDLETGEIYDIVNNQPNQIIGLISSSGKVKFN